MRHACHKPRNPGLMSARRFKRDERDDGMQTLLGVPAENGRERGKNGGRGVEARLLRQGIALRKAELPQRRGVLLWTRDSDGVQSGGPGGWSWSP
ncbi:unnamed protein product [Gadus morhua 'NCC']